MNTKYKMDIKFPYQTYQNESVYHVVFCVHQSISEKSLDIGKLQKLNP